MTNRSCAARWPTGPFGRRKSGPGSFVTYRPRLTRRSFAGGRRKTRSNDGPRRLPPPFGCACLRHSPPLSPSVSTPRAVRSSHTPPASSWRARLCTQAQRDAEERSVAKAKYEQERAAWEAAEKVRVAAEATDALQQALLTQDAPTLRAALNAYGPVRAQPGPCAVPATPPLLCQRGCQVLTGAYVACRRFSKKPAEAPSPI